MGVIDYKAPQIDVDEVNSQDVLCSSPSGENTERFVIGENSYDESDWD